MWLHVNHIKSVGEFPTCKNKQTDATKTKVTVTTLNPNLLFFMLIFYPS